MLDTVLAFLKNCIFLILHVTPSISSFPKPLSPEEERKNLILYKEYGDENAKKVLIECNLRLVAHIIKKYYTPCSELDDLISIGTIGLIKGISSFNPGKGTSLSTYCARCIENEILMHFRAQKKTSHEVYLNDSLDYDKDGNSISLINILCTDDNTDELVNMRISSAKLYKAISILPLREKKVICMRYGLLGSKEYTQREIASKMGISRSYVSRIEKKAIELLRNSF